MRALVLRFAVVIGSLAMIAAAIVPAAAQSGYDRPGGDYASAADGNPIDRQIIAVEYRFFGV